MALRQLRGRSSLVELFSLCTRASAMNVDLAAAADVHSHVTTVTDVLLFVLTFVTFVMHQQVIVSSK